MVFPQLIPTPYRLLAGAVAILLTATAVFSLGWSRGSNHVQTSWDKAKAIQVKQALEAEQAAMARERSWLSQLRKAETDANDREEKRQAALAAAGAADQRLRNAIGSIHDKLPTSSPAASRETADTALAVFGECAAALGEMAEQADGIAIDRQTLIEAWPK